MSDPAGAPRPGSSVEGDLTGAGIVTASSGSTEPADRLVDLDSSYDVDTSAGAVGPAVAGLLADAVGRSDHAGPAEAVGPSDVDRPADALGGADAVGRTDAVGRAEADGGTDAVSGADAGAGTDAAGGDTGGGTDAVGGGDTGRGTDAVGGAGAGGGGDAGSGVGAGLAGAGEGAPVQEELDELADPERLRSALEAVLLVVDTPTSSLMLAQVLGRSVPEVESALRSLRDEFDAGGRGMDLREVADGWRLYSRDEFAPYVERFILDGQQARLTQASLETLAVIAYRQPVTRSRISGIRGVSVDAVMRTLLTRGLVEECGADPDTGGGLYRTTRLFLEKMGL
ncbi:MAG TPA: SMC-Scp complex subunit ScpB, partial [Mycobacteriales bacterium]